MFIPIFIQYIIKTQNSKGGKMGVALLNSRLQLGHCNGWYKTDSERRLTVNILWRIGNKNINI